MLHYRTDRPAGAVVPRDPARRQINASALYEQCGSLGGVVIEARKDSRVAIAEDDFKAFRDARGVWSDYPPPLLIQDLRDDFLVVEDPVRATVLIREAKAALWS